MWSNQWLIKCHCIYAFVDFCYDNEGIQRIEASRSGICATLSLSFSLSVNFLKLMTHVLILAVFWRGESSRLALIT
ncbi:hypothetical protein ACFX2C_028805 [Malus domestica]